MGSNMVYVIKDRDGNYIAPGNFITQTIIEQGWHYQKFNKDYFNEDCTGLVYYSDKKLAEKELRYLKNLGYDFFIEHINITELGKTVN